MNRSSRRLAASLVVGVFVAACGTSASPAATGPGAQEAPGVLRAFVDQTTNPSRSFHFVQTGSVSVGVRTMDITYELDAAGANLSGVLKVNGQTVEVRVVDGSGFSNAGGGWQALPAGTDLARDTVDVFRYVGDASNLQFLARLDGSDGPEFRFRAAKPIPYQTSEMRKLGVTGSIVELDLYVRPNGVPVSINFASTAKSGNTTVDGRSNILFTRWGEPMVIEAPF